MFDLTMRVGRVDALIPTFWVFLDKPFPAVQTGFGNSSDVSPFSPAPLRLCARPLLPDLRVSASFLFTFPLPSPLPLLPIRGASRRGRGGVFDLTMRVGRLDALIPTFWDFFR